MPDEGANDTRIQKQLLKNRFELICSEANFFWITGKRPKFKNIFSSNNILFQ